MKELVIVPTYNEVENIGSFLTSVFSQMPSVEVLVVDDSSPDGTGKVVETMQEFQKGLHLVSRPVKNGLSAAYQEGFQWAIANEFDRIVQMDADFSHRPIDLPKIFEALKSSDVGIGCRYISGGGTEGWSKLREFISRGGNFYAQRVLQMRFKDLTGGFNGWRRHVLERILEVPLKSRGYAFQVELKYRAFREGFSIQEVPIQFDQRRFGHSKMSGKIVWEAAFRVFQMRRSATA